MLIRLLPKFVMASPDGVWANGDLVDVPDGAAHALIECGAATPVSDQPVDGEVDEAFNEVAEEPFVGRYEKSVKKRGRPRK